MSVSTPPLTRAQRGRLGAKKRWAPENRRVARLDDLTAEQKSVVLALVAAAKAAKAAKKEAAPDVAPGTAAPGGQTDATPTE